jgi:AcrR family transcriptional regulator
MGGANLPAGSRRGETEVCMSGYDKGATTKRRILDACMKLFYTKGYDETTFADICAEARVNQGSIYYHFRKKSELFHYVMERIIEQDDSIAQRYAGPEESTYPRIILRLYVYWHRFFHDKNYRRIMLPRGNSLPHDELDSYRIFLSLCGSFIRDPSTFYKKHRLEIVAAFGIDQELVLYAYKNLDRHSCGELAEFEIRSIMAVFNINPALAGGMTARAKKIAGTKGFISSCEALAASTP